MLLIAAAYFALFGGEYSLFEMRRVRTELVQARLAVDSARAEVARLKARQDSLEHDSATIERIARERFGMIRNGERLYRFATVPDSARADSAARSSNRSRRGPPAGDSVPR